MDRDRELCTKAASGRFSFLRITARNVLVETGSAPLRRLQPAIVRTELLRYNVVLTMGSGQAGVGSTQG